VSTEQTTEALAVNDIAELTRGFELSLRARNRSPITVTSYVRTVGLFRDFLVRMGMPTEVDRINREHVESFIADQLERWKPKTAAVRYGDLLQFFKWAVGDGEIPISPMVNMDPPVVPEAPVPVVRDDDMTKLFKACEGKSFEERRDLAILRVFFDCGLRLAELTHLQLADIDWVAQEVTVLGKGRRPRSVTFGARTAQALDRYLRTRRGHPLASSSALWLGPKGPLTDSGVAQMLRRRCKRAGIAQLHPHQLRHTAVHHNLAEGVTDGQAMRIFGWKSRQMLNRYGAAAADERARDARRRLSPGDRL